MVEATLRQTRAKRWAKTAAYDRLDGSEKSAVSYFHGMVGARLLTEHLFLIPNLVHLDAVLKLMKQPLKGSRPDFVGHDPVSVTYSMPLEAKGRSGRWSGDPLATAKKQAKLLPTIVGATSSIAAASLTYFEDDIWRTYIEDPPAKRSSFEPIPPGLLTALYYLPLVRVVGAGDRDTDLEARSVIGVPEESGAAIEIPNFIFEPLVPLIDDIAVDVDSLISAGDEVRENWAARTTAVASTDNGDVGDSGARANVETTDRNDRSESASQGGDAGLEAEGLPKAPVPSVLALRDAAPDQHEALLADMDKAWTGLDLITVKVDDPWSDVEVPD